MRVKAATFGRPRVEVGLLATAMVIAAVFRLPAAFGPALWRDEAQLLMVLQLGNVPTIVGFLANHESHPPLYYLLAKGWASLFGYGDRASVTLALVCGLLVVVMAYRTARTLFSPRAGVLAALLVSTSSTLIFMAASVRPYAFLGLVALATTLLAWRLVDTGTWGAVPPYAAAAAVLVYTHNWSWLIIAAHGILTLWIGGRLHGREFFLKWVTAYGILALIYLPWLPILIRQARQAGHFPNAQSAGRLLYECVFYLTGLAPEVVLFSALTIGELLRLDGRVDRPSGQRATWGASGFFVSIPVLVTVLAFAVRPVVNVLVRICFSTLTPILLVGVAGLLGRERGRNRGLAAGIAGVLVAVSAAYSASLYPFDRTNVNEVAAYLSREAQPGDLVVVMPIYLASSFVRYYSGTAPVIAYPDEPVRAPVEYDHRLARDTASAPLEHFLSVISHAADAHRRIWYVIGALPGHLVGEGSLGDPRPGRELSIRQAIEARYGAPSLDVGRGRIGLFESVRSLLYLPPGSGPVKRDPGESRGSVRPPS